MISAIVLAAGSSTRMNGTNKLLLPYKNKTIIENTVDVIISAGVQEVIVITGFDSARITNKLKSRNVNIIYNNNHLLGLTSSIQKGIEVASGNAYMICLGDMTLIEPNEYLFLMNQFKLYQDINHKSIGIPTYKGQNGNPAIFSSFYKPHILSHPFSEGCKEIVQVNNEHLRMIPVDADHFIRDIDTIADYQTLQSL